MSPKETDALEATKSALEQALTRSKKRSNSRVVLSQRSYTEIAQNNTISLNSGRAHKKPR